MNRLAWIVAAIALGCGSDPQPNGADAGSDVNADVPTHCVVDFPCSNPWACADSTHWVEMQSVAKPPCTGLMCESTGVTHACDPGLECVMDAPPGTSAPCAYGGQDGCLPADAGAFSPSPMATPPTKQPGVCTTTQVQQAWSFCLDPTTYDATKCTSFGQLNKACIQCLAGTVTVAGSSFVPNVGGCYALLDGASAPGSCAALDDANMQCAAAACVGGCSSWPDAFEACVLASRTSACASFPICNADAGASYATCEPTSVKDFFLGFGEALCGP
jgi:hypothetical protein